MNQVNQDEPLTTINITPRLLQHIAHVLKNKGWGSVEIYIENYHITQITERTITKVAPPRTAKTQIIIKNSRV